jgi:acetolactate synthase-1/2/3 large subunit
MIKLTDYITNRLATKYGITDVFMISGGGAMHLVDSVGKQPGLRYICPHHEQACAIAAEGYSRATGKLAVVVVTSGPGGTNTLTGVIGQWLDSVPVLYLSGQVKQETTIESCRAIGLRQLGDQEINITDIVRPVTKYATIVNHADDVRYHLDKAVYIATHGRPGPVWLDIPLDVQASLIDENSLRHYNPSEDKQDYGDGSLSVQIDQVVSLLRQAERPVFLAGQGIRIGNAIGLFRELVERLGIPVLTSFCGFDLIPSDHLLFVGRPGTLGSRAGNFALQNADVLLSVGSRNNVRQISYSWGVFARNAKKVVVDIDKAELDKPTFRPDLAIQADAGEFLRSLAAAIQNSSLPDWEWWRTWCVKRRDSYPVVVDDYWAKDSPVNPYCFIDALTQVLSEDSRVVAGNGTACVCLFQAGKVKANQRMFWNSGCASMGYDLPAAIGACVGSGLKPVVCLAGDGSLQMNLQEIQTLVHYRLPVKLFVLNNNGYVSIRQTQDNFFEGRYVARGPESGVSFPDIIRVAGAYGLPAYRIDTHDNIRHQINTVLQEPGPVVCEVMLDPKQNFAPRVSSEKKPDGTMVSKPLEDLYPFLPRAEFYGNMIVKVD